MIQRVQSIFLALVAVLFIVSFFMPVYRVGDEAFGLMKIPLLLIPLACISILALVTVFMYKNRKGQIKICRAGVLLSALLSSNAIVFPQFFLHNVDKAHLDYGVSAYLLLANIILFAFAARFIKKDDDLVKAADRLR